MSAIRRIYLYLLAFGGLLMLAGGAANLGRVLVEALTGPTTATYVREEVSRWGAAAIVGLPVWLVHWWWAQRASHASPVEQLSALRRLYVFAVLAAALLAGASALHEVLVDSTWQLLPTVGVSLVVWLYHWREAVLLADHGGTLRRWYLYGSAFVGFLLLLGGSRAVLHAVWDMLAASTAPNVPRAVIADALIGLGIWLLHWPGAARVFRETDRRATLRSVYLFLSLAVAVGGAVAGLTQVLYYALGRALGVERPGGVGGSLLEAAAGPASLLVVYGLAWLYTRAALREQALMVEAPRQAGVRRLYTYLVALIGLVALAVGAAGLLWIVGDALTSAPGTQGSQWWRDRVALFATLTSVGLLVWLLHWRPASRLAGEELTAFSRRLYAYLALIAGSMTVLGSAAAVAYRVLTLALGAQPSPSLASDLAHDLADVLVAGLVVGYHWSTRPAGEASPAPEKPVEAVLRVKAADGAMLERGIRALREAGLEVEPAA
jgi:hypothetical protein